MLTTSPEFRTIARHALADAGLRKAPAFGKPQLVARRTAAVADPRGVEGLCDIGRDIKDPASARTGRRRLPWSACSTSSPASPRPAP